MSKINCIIVEDEPLAVKVLTDYIAEVPFLQLQQVFKDAISATEWIHDNKTDLLFLDIHLPKLKGMAFLRTLVNPPAVIITTAYHQYAVEGFDLNVTDYLLKPIEFERFLVAVNKVQGARNKQPGTSNPEQGTEVKQLSASSEAISKDHLFINMNKKRVKILFADILYLESQMDYVKIVTTKRSYLASMTTNEIEKILPAKLFRRVHRSYIISINRIDSYTSEMVEINGEQIPIGRSYRGIIDSL